MFCVSTSSVPQPRCLHQTSAARKRADPTPIERTSGRTRMSQIAATSRRPVEKDQTGGVERDDRTADPLVRIVRREQPPFRRVESLEPAGGTFAFACVVVLDQGASTSTSINRIPPSPEAGVDT